MTDLVVYGSRGIDAFFAEASDIVAGERHEFSMGHEVLLELIATPAVRGDFDRRLATLNNLESKQLILDFVRDAAEALADSADDNDRKVELLDRASLSVAASVTVAGIGTTVASIATGAAAVSFAGPIGLLVGGLVGVVASAWGRDRLKRQANRNRSAGRKLRRLIGKD